MSAILTSAIIGASGQVGTQIRRLLASEPTVSFGVERRPGQVHLDLSILTPLEADDVLDRHGVGAVYCLGGMTDVERCELEPDRAMLTNCDGPGILAAAAWRRGIPFAYLSTDYIFDGDAGPYGETAKPNPLNAYGRSKWLGELAVQSAHHAATIIRTTVVYGPDPNARNFCYTLRRASTAGLELSVADDQLSTPTYNKDLAIAVVTLIRSRAEGIFNACGPELLSRIDFAHSVCRNLGLPAARLRPVPTRELKQLARRPLGGGLITEKLVRAHPQLSMSSVSNACRDWLLSPGSLL